MIQADDLQIGQAAGEYILELIYRQDAAAFLMRRKNERL